MFSLHIWTSTFCLHLTLPFFFRDRVFGGRILGTRFRGPDFGDRISGTGFWNQEAKSNQFFLNLELCSVYIFLLISTSTFCLYLTLPSFFRDWVSGTGFRGLDFGIRELRLVQSTYLDFYFLSSLDITFLFQGPGFWGPDFGDQVSGTRFRGPDFGERILGTGFWNQEAKSNQFFLNLELCSVYIFLLISTSTFCLHLTLPSFFRDWVSGAGFRGLDFGIRELRFVHATYLDFYFLSSLDITFLFSGTGFRGLDFGDRISGTEFWGPDFGDRILWTGFRGLDFRIRKPSLLKF